MIFTKKSPLEKEWEKMQRQEVLYLQKQMQKNESKLNQFLEDKVPTSLQETLDKTFAKAFYLVFEKGTSIIEKTYRKEEMEKEYQINEFASQIKGTRRSLKKFSKKANGASKFNTLLSLVSGVGLGALGVGIPDIILLTAMMLKNMYEIALHYGKDMWDAKSGAYDYEAYTEEEIACYNWMELLSDERNLYLLEINQAPEHVHEALAEGKYIKTALKSDVNCMILPDQITPWMERKMRNAAAENGMTVSTAQVAEYVLWLFE